MSKTPQKRAFKPNLAAAGKKEEQKEASTSKRAPSARGRGRGGRGGAGGRRQQQVIETEGVFSSGPARADAKKSDSAGGGFFAGRGVRLGGESSRRVKLEDDSDDEAKSAAWKTTTDGGDWIDEDLDGDKHALDELLNDNFIADLKSATLQPIELGQRQVTEPKQPPNRFPVDEETTASRFQSLVDQMESKNFPAEAPNLFLLQLPSNLSDMLASNVAASKVAAVDNEDMEVCVDDSSGSSRVKAEPEAPAKEAPPPPPPKHCLADLPAGRVGKLQLLKSGKVRLLVGNAKFDVEFGSDVNCVQDIVSLNPDAHADSGEIHTLGTVRQRLVCTQNLLELVDQHAASTSPL